MADYDPDNLFAKIIAGDIPAHTVHEDPDTLTFMDIMPRADGHCLVIPKSPSRNLFDIEPETLARVMARVQFIARAAMRAFNADGILVQSFNEAAAGQTVFHTHVHIVPRFEGTDLKPHAGIPEDDAVLRANAEKLRGALAAL